MASLANTNSSQLLSPLLDCSFASLSEIYNLGSDLREDALSERIPKKHPLVVTK
jgi:hypothetical protein